MNRLLAGLAVLSAAIVLAACATPGTDTFVNVNSSSAPAWVTQGTGVFPDARDGSAIYAVGMTMGIRNQTLAAAAAGDRARQELADELIKRGTVPAQARALAKSRGRIVDHWTDPSSGTVYSLARANMAVAADDGPAESAAPEPAAAPDAQKAASKSQWWEK